MTTYAPAQNTDWDDVLTSLGLEPSTPPRSRGPRRRAVAVCGTPSGYRRHHKLGQPTCAICRAAWNEAGAQQRAAREARGGHKPRPTIECGTHQGADRHYRRKEPLCQPCREAYSLWQSAYRAARRAEAAAS